MQKYETVRSRWKRNWSNDLSFRTLERCMNSSIAVAEDLATSRAKMEKTGHYSSKGLAEAVRNYAAAHVVPELRSAAVEVDRAKARTQKRRDALTVAKPDKTDLAGAVRRMEARSFLRELPMEQRSQLLFDEVDPMLIEAVFEVPAIMSA